MSFRFADVFGHGLVGQQHELLDEPVGLLTFLDVHSRGVGVLVEDELHLLTLEVDGTALVARRPQHCGDAVQGEDGVGNVGAVADAGVYDGLRLLVGHAAVAAYDSLAHPGLVHLAFIVHLHDHAEA